MSQSLEGNLHRFLCDRFGSGAEFRRFIRALPDGQEIVLDLPEGNVSLRELIYRGIEELKKRALIDSNLFNALSQQFPKFTDEWMEFARQFSVSTASGLEMDFVQGLRPDDEDRSSVQSATNTGVDEPGRRSDAATATISVEQVESVRAQAARQKPASGRSWPGIMRHQRDAATAIGSRVDELAEELGFNNKIMVNIIRGIGIEVHGETGTLDDEDVQAVRRHVRACWDGALHSVQFVLDGQDAESLPRVVLEFEGRSTYYVVLVDEQQNHHVLGNVLILRSPVKELGLPSRFDALSSEDSSAGTLEYYNSLLEHPRYAPAILTGLQDAAWSIRAARNFHVHPGSQDSPLRDTDVLMEIRAMLSYLSTPGAKNVDERPGWLFRNAELSMTPLELRTVTRIWRDARPFVRHIAEGDRVWLWDPLGAKRRIVAQGRVATEVFDLEDPDTRAKFHTRESTNLPRYVVGVDIDRNIWHYPLTSDAMTADTTVARLLRQHASAPENVQVPHEKIRVLEAAVLARSEAATKKASKPGPDAAPSVGVPRSDAPAMSASGGKPPGGEKGPARPRCLTLSVREGRAALYDGCVLDDASAGAPIWSRSLADPPPWSGDAFHDGSAAIGLTHARRALPATWSRAEVERFGDDLSTVLFGETPAPAVVKALAGAAGESIRLVLCLDAAAAEVPWEYLRVDGHFLAERQISFIRHVPTQAESCPIKLAGVERLLFAAANPETATEARFDSDAHYQVLTRALRGIDLDIDFAPRCTRDALREGLTLAHRPVQGLHFLGHGRTLTARRAPTLVLHSVDDRAEQNLSGVGGDAVVRKDDELDASVLATFLARSKARFVFLESCHSGAVRAEHPLTGMAWDIVRAAGLPVVAMQMAAPQEFATRFAAEFYERLAARGYDLELAVYDARTIQIGGRVAFGIPVLYADLRAVKEWPELPARTEGWAKFAPVVLDREAARQLWGDAVPPGYRAAIDAVFADEVRGAADQYPPPPEQGAPLEALLATLLRSLGTPEARARVEQIREVAPVPAPTPTLPLSGARIDAEEAALGEPDDRGVQEILARYSFPAELVWRIVGELRAGRHVLLTGPVGTGKTTLAREIASKVFGYEPLIETASADWTRFEVIGGFWPTPGKDGAGVQFGFRPGAFLEAVLANWTNRADPDGVVRWQRTRATEAGPRGRWLLLDELNRADMDRAMGGLFTALESHRLRIPIAGGPGDALSAEVPVPGDFRVLATINAADRHYLFRLSDALKRRFAFVHVPVTTDWAGEWSRIGGAPLDADDDAVELRRFTYLARLFHPVGTALLQGALRFLSASAGAAGEWRLHQAIAGSILPNLEDLPRSVLNVLHAWAVVRQPAELAGYIDRALPQPLAAGRPALLAGPFAALLPSLRGHADELPTGEDRAWLCKYAAAWLTRAADAPPLHALAATLGEMLDHAPPA